MINEKLKIVSENETAACDLAHHWQCNVLERMKFRQMRGRLVQGRNNGQLHGETYFM